MLLNEVYFRDCRRQTLLVPTVHFADLTAKEPTYLTTLRQERHTCLLKNARWVNSLRFYKLFSCVRPYIALIFCLLLRL